MADPRRNHGGEGDVGVANLGCEEAVERQLGRSSAGGGRLFFVFAVDKLPDKMIKCSFRMREKISLRKT